MKFETTYRLEDFILNTRWADLPAEVRERIKGCYISDECGPRGEACKNIGFDWLADKFRRITDPVLTAEA